jgi:hypothetical protein
VTRDQSNVTVAFAAYRDVANTRGGNNNVAAASESKDALGTDFFLAVQGTQVRFGAMPSECSMTCYHGALALNEIAIEMLKLDSHEYGIATLKDAIGLLKSSFAEETASPADSTVIRPDVEAKVHLAQERLAGEQATHPSVSRLQRHFQVLSVHDLFTAEATEPLLLRRQVSQSPPIWLIRIDPTNAMQENGSLGPPQIEASILLQNMGAAYYHMSKQPNGTKHESAKLLAASIRLFQLSNDIIMKLVRTNDASLVSLPERLYIAIAAKQNQIKILRDDSNHTRDVQYNLTMLDHLRYSLDHIVKTVYSLSASCLHLAPAA